MRARLCAWGVAVAAFCASAGMGVADVGTQVPLRFALEADGLGGWALAVDLDEGWKTHGAADDQGLPSSQATALESSNAAEVRFAWPEPKALTAFDEPFLGYDAPFRVPIVVVPQDPAQPVVLRVHAQGVACGAQCIPVFADMEAVLAPVAP